MSRSRLSICPVALTIALAVAACASGEVKPPAATAPSAEEADAAAPGRSAGLSSCHLQVLLVGEGIGLEVEAGNIAPGCAAVGPGLTLPRPSPDADDEAGLASCVRKLKTMCPVDEGIVILATESETHGRVIKTLDTLKPITSRIAFKRRPTGADP